MLSPIVVTIAKGKHATQPYTVTINPPGRSEPYRMKQRYADRKGAKRGALRQLKAYSYSTAPGRLYYAYINGKHVLIQFN